MTDANTPSTDSNAEANQLPDPALFSAPPSKKKSKRRGVEDPSPLTITSLMDIMTIILVFLLKSYSNNPVQLKQAPDLKLPFSSSDKMPSESTAVTVTLNNIIVDAEQPIIIENGSVAEQDLSSGGFLIDPLYTKLQEAVDHQKKVARYNEQAEFTGEITIISDRHVPFSLLSKVMYTAGQAQFSKFKFAVIKQGG